MNDEVWKDISGFEGLYQISNYGRVLNVKRNRIKVACLNHKDFNKLNNHVDNLEWTTGDENRSHYQESDRYKIWLQTVIK